MKFVFASYVMIKSFNQPDAWIKRISAYAGIKEELAKRHEVVSIQQINFEGEYLQNDVSYHFLKFRLPSKYFPVTLNKDIKQQQPDIVVIQGTHFPIQVLLLRLKLGSKTRIIVHHHAERPFTGIKKMFQRLADRHIDAYLFASRQMGLSWVKKGNLASPQKIHEVMEVSSVFHQIDKVEAKGFTGIKKKLVYLWVGRLNANKDPIATVKGFLKFAQRYPDAVLYMIYHNDELLPDVYELLEEHPNGNAVKMIGQAANNELLYWYNSADFFVSGSHYEGSGTAVCEAMSCGCIPVVTNIDSFRMITNNGNCGLLYQPGNVDELCKVLLQTVEIDKAEKRRLCLEYFRDHLSFSAIARGIEEIAASL